MIGRRATPAVTTPAVASPGVTGSSVTDVTGADTTADPRSLPSLAGARAGRRRHARAAAG